MTTRIRTLATMGTAAPSALALAAALTLILVSCGQEDPTFRPDGGVVVEKGATKVQIKKEVEREFAVKVASVNTLITLDGRKKAFVKLKPGFSADDVAAKLKIA